MNREIFNNIYNESTWGVGSGPGSNPDNCIEWIEYANKLIQSKYVHTVLDLGCGDWQVGKLLNLQHKKYTGVDVSSVVIEKTKENSSDSVSFICDDIEFMDFPMVDLILIKDVLQHLPNSSVLRIMDKIVKSSRYALICNDYEPYDLVNSDIGVGGWRPLNLSDKPFSYKLEDLKRFKSEHAEKQISLYSRDGFNP